SKSLRRAFYGRSVLIVCLCCNLPRSALLGEEIRETLLRAKNRACRISTVKIVRISRCRCQVIPDVQKIAVHVRVPNPAANLRIALVREDEFIAFPCSASLLGPALFFPVPRL